MAKIWTPEERPLLERRKQAAEEQAERIRAGISVQRARAQDQRLSASQRATASNLARKGEEQLKVRQNLIGNIDRALTLIGRAERAPTQQRAQEILTSDKRAGIELDRQDREKQEIMQRSGLTTQEYDQLNTASRQKLREELHRGTLSSTRSQSAPRAAPSSQESGPIVLEGEALEYVRARDFQAEFMFGRQKAKDFPQIFGVSKEDRPRPVASELLQVGLENLEGKPQPILEKGVEKLSFPLIIEAFREYDFSKIQLEQRWEMVKQVPGSAWEAVKGGPEKTGQWFPNLFGGVERPETTITPQTRAQLELLKPNLPLGFKQGTVRPDTTGGFKDHVTTFAQSFHFDYEIMQRFRKAETSPTETAGVVTRIARDTVGLRAVFFAEEVVGEFAGSAAIAGLGTTNKLITRLPNLSKNARITAGTAIGGAAEGGTSYLVSTAGNFERPNFKGFVGSAAFGALFAGTFGGMIGSKLTKPISRADQALISSGQSLRPGQRLLETAYWIDIFEKGGDDIADSLRGTFARRGYKVPILSPSISTFSTEPASGGIKTTGVMFNVGTKPSPTLSPQATFAPSTTRNVAQTANIAVLPRSTMIFPSFAPSLSIIPSLTPTSVPSPVTTTTPTTIPGIVPTATITPSTTPTNVPNLTTSTTVPVPVVSIDPNLFFPPLFGGRGRGKKKGKARKAKQRTQFSKSFAVILGGLKPTVNVKAPRLTGLELRG